MSLVALAILKWRGVSRCHKNLIFRTLATTGGKWHFHGRRLIVMNLLKKWMEKNGTSATMYRPLFSTQKEREKQKQKQPSHGAGISSIGLWSWFWPLGPMSLWPDRRDANQQCVGWEAVYFLTQERSFTKDVTHQPVLIVILCIRPQEPWLMHTPWRDCFKVVEVSRQIYTNRSGIGVGFTDVNPYSMIQILSSYNWPYM